jgi:hypothetical protein
MVKIFIFCSNLNFISSISQIIIEKKINANVIGIQNYISKDGLQLCRNSKPHLIICEQRDYKKIKKILKEDFIWLIFSNESNTSKTTVLNQIETISKDTKYTHKIEISNYRRQYFNKLVNLNFNPNLIGTLYILDCIVCIKENPYSPSTHLRLTKYLKIIARKYNTPINQVIWNIRSAIEEMYKNTNREFRNKLYGSDCYISFSRLLKTISLL